jgi:hypothetical protein
VSSVCGREKTNAERRDVICHMNLHRQKTWLSSISGRQRTNAAPKILQKVTLMLRCNLDYTGRLRQITETSSDRSSSAFLTPLN